MSDQSDDSLSGAATAALGEPEDEGTAEQDHLPGTDHAKVKFVGMAWDTLIAPALKEEIVVEVRGMVVGHGEEVMANGEVREICKVKVTSIVPIRE